MREEITYFVVFTGNSRLFAIFRFCSLFHKQEHVWQFTFIYSANSHLKLPQSALHGKVKTQDPNILEEPPPPNESVHMLGNKWEGRASF